MWIFRLLKVRQSLHKNGAERKLKDPEELREGQYRMQNGDLRIGLRNLRSLQKY